MANYIRSPQSPGIGGLQELTASELLFVQNIGDHSYTDGQLLIGNSSTGNISFATITAGTGITVTNGHGSITIAATGGAGAGDFSTNTSTSVLNEIVLFADTSGKLGKRSTGTGIATLTSGVLSATSTTGSGNVVLATSATLVTPILGAATATSINKMAITAPATSSTLAVADGKTFTVSNTLTLVGTDSTTMTFPSTTATIARTDAANTFTGHQTIEGVTTTGATGTGLLVFGTSPTLTTAALGSSTATTQTPADNSTKVATTAYVDAAVLGQNFKEAALVATTANLVGTYLSGVFTYTATGTDTIDGVALALGNRVLVKNQTTTFQNGIYTVTTAGTTGVAGVLTRSSDANTSGQFKTGDSLFVTSGTAQGATTWAYTGIDSPTIGTDAITFAQTAGQGSFTAGNGITITGVSIAIDTSVTVDKTTVQTLTNKTLTSPTFTAPALGTPASGVMTNVTGVPAAAILAGSFGAGAYVISTSLQAATIELGNATDTTLSRVSAGLIAVEGVTLVDVSTSQSLTNKTLTTPVLTGLPTGTGVASAATASTLVARDASANVLANNFVDGFTTTATAAGTTTMTITSTGLQVWTGSSTQTVKLPTTSVIAGQQYTIVNQSTGAVTVQSSGANTITILASNTSATFTAVVATPTTAANWNSQYFADIVTSGKSLSVSNILTLAGTDTTTMTFPSTSATIARTDAANTFTGAQTFSNAVINTNNAITATSNAATVPITARLNTVTNSSAATLTITMTTTSATDGQMTIVRILDSSAVAQTITWVNTENSTVTAPTTSNGSTTLFLTVGFIYNGGTSKWRCIASA